jgi:hypothetical protein
MEEGEA